MIAGMTYSGLLSTEEAKRKLFPESCCPFSVGTRLTHGSRSEVNHRLTNIVQFTLEA